jgi:hypothetical protein
MTQLRIDPFVSAEPEFPVDSETRPLLKERMKSADRGCLVSAEEARQRIQQRLSKSDTTKTH